jgi:hypothetical protein
MCSALLSAKRGLWPIKKNITQTVRRKNTAKLQGNQHGKGGKQDILMVFKLHTIHQKEIGN